MHCEHDEFRRDVGTWERDHGDVSDYRDCRPIQPHVLRYAQADAPRFWRRHQGTCFAAITLLDQRAGQAPDPRSRRAHRAVARSGHCDCIERVGWCRLAVRLPPQREQSSSPTRVLLLDVDSGSGAATESSSEPPIELSAACGRSRRATQVLGAQPKNGWLWGECVQTPVYGTGSEYEMHLKPRGPFRVCPDTLTFACVNFTAHGLAEAHDMPTAATVYLSPEMRPPGAGMLQCAPVTMMCTWRRPHVPSPPVSRERPSTRSQRREATLMCQGSRPVESSLSCGVNS